MSYTRRTHAFPENGICFIVGRVRHVLVEGLYTGLRMSIKLIVVLLPAAAFVFVLQQFDLLRPIAGFLRPLMSLAGLPGEAGLVFATGALLNVYPAIAMLVTLDFSVQETTVIALMILICHSLVVECSIQARAGSNPLRMGILRLVAAFVTGIAAGRYYGLVSVDSVAQPDALATVPGATGLVQDFFAWIQSTSTTIALMIVIITGLMVIQRLLEASGLLRRISSWFEPLVLLFGLPRSTAFLWLVGNTMGLTYGSAVLIQERERGALKPAEIDALNHHLAISHSLIEDTLLFVALGAGAGALVLPRLAVAAVVVWILRLVRLHQRSDQLCEN
ncbi:MAG: nucleoside recognition protein [Spirochaetaceae bacterium]|nr:MAG: nucleoside recognition protein [Spirochaetaceae bacterium]